MDIVGDGYRINYEDNTVVISGKLSLMLENYTELENYFKKILDTKPSRITLDIRNLEYLNSAGIKTICVNLILEAGDIEGLQMQIICSKKYTWQKETIPTFEELIDEIMIIFE